MLTNVPGKQPWKLIYYNISLLEVFYTVILSNDLIQDKKCI